MINIKNISKKYMSGKVSINALKDASLHIREGEFIMLRGPSGSGKSTLLNIIGCLTRITSGNYILENQDISHWPDHFMSSIRSKKMGFIFQQFNLISGYPAWENITVPLIPLGVPKKERRKRAMHMLEKLNLETRADFMSQELSGGQQQLVAIARALINNPEIILADEPSSNIDVTHAANLKEILAGLKKTGKTIIISSHIKSAIEELVDKTVYVENGCILSPMP